MALQCILKVWKRKDECYVQLNIIQNVQECDATKDDKTTKAGLINQL